MDKPEAESLYDSGKEPTVAKLLELDQENQALKIKIASLKTNSTNSSKPPSSDGPCVVRNKQPQSSRKQGGQPGHLGKKRELLPADEMDHIVDFYPSGCEICSLELSPERHKETSAPSRHQTVDLPEIQLIKTEYRCHELECDNGHRTRAILPPEIAQSNFGPRVHAATTYLIAEHLATRRGIVEIMKTLFNLDISLGAVCNTIDRVSTQLQPIVEQIRQTLPASPTLNIDDTGWKSQGKRLNLWAFVSPLVVYFCIAASRGAKVLTSVLGDVFLGIITSDDHSAYRAYHKGLRQQSFAHLIRKFKDLKETRSSPDAYNFSKNMLKEVGHLFTYWHAFLLTGFSRQELVLATALIRGRMKHCCLHYQNSQDKAVRSRATRMLKNWDHLFTFLSHEGVEPTNNIAERAQRHAVQWRKICFGNQSDEGVLFTERILTVISTCKLKGKNPFHFLTQVMDAAFNGTPRPSLI